MIYKTVGAAGDYPSWGEAWTSLVVAGALSDDYEFRQIGDCTINNNWPFGNVNFNGRTVRWYVDWDDCHQGDPTKGYKTFLNGASGRIFCRAVAGATVADVMEMENLFIEQTTLNDVILLTVAASSNVDALTVNQNNLLIKGFSSVVGRGISWNVNRLRVNFSNSKIWNIREPVYGNFITSTPGDDTTGYHIAENIVMGQHESRGGAFAMPSLLGMQWILRNCVAVGGDPDNPGVATYDWVGSLDVFGHQVYNCAGSDGTLTSANFLVKDDIQDNIVDTDEFASVADTDADFYFLKQGNLAVSFTRDPSGTLLVNQPCKFDPEVVLTPGSLRLGQTGIASTLESFDIAGESRPGADGFYAIGAHEQQY